jgi:hypothetical protein
MGFLQQDTMTSFSKIFEKFDMAAKELAKEIAKMDSKLNEIINGYMSQDDFGPEE